MKKFSEYIGVFLITFSICMLILSTIPPHILNAEDLSEEDINKIEQSSISANYTIDTYKEMMEQAHEKANSCLPDDEEIDPNQTILNTVLKKNNKESICFLEYNDQLDRIKKETEMEQILETYRMMNYYFNLINSTLETAVEEVKETVNDRKRYTS